MTFICSLLIEYFKGRPALNILMIKYKTLEAIPSLFSCSMGFH